MSKLRPEVTSNDHMQGNVNASVELVEYGDYECPHCGRAYPVIKKIQKKMGDNLKFVFRNFPLSEVHPDARMAATAAEAADAQGKFWEMHDVIFENQDSLNYEDLMGYAESLGLDMDQFEKDFNSRKYSDRVDEDFESGLRSGVNGTPGFFVNGEKYNGIWEDTELLHFLQSKVHAQQHEHH
ncbi:thioredoxin domain-containing protein [Chitinophagaceae bacterium 26-R-25]|nr:thioredoxin domain-containing protein [Chitinophagaceae bacterium 26-R-25]